MMYLAKMEVRLDEVDLTESDAVITATQDSGMERDWDVSLDRTMAQIVVKSVTTLPLTGALNALRREMSDFDEVLGVAENHSLELTWRFEGTEVVGSNY